MSSLAEGATSRSREAWRWPLMLACCDLCLAVDLAMLSPLLPTWAVALTAYVALSVAAVTVLYVRAARGTNPGPLLKGATRPWLQPLFLPFRAVAYAVTAFMRVLLAREGGLTEVTPGIFVGARPFAIERARLSKLEIAYVVDLCAELPTNTSVQRAPFERLGVPTLDGCTPTDDEMARAVEWIAARYAPGRKVLIHCAFGRGRSATLAAATMVRLGLAHDADDAITQMRRARYVRVRGAQRAALERYIASVRASAAP